MEIRIDDLKGPEIQQLLSEHVSEMRRTSPPDSMHALDIDGPRKPEITFWSIWSGNELTGCGALKELSPEHGEIRSMRTASPHRHKRVASRLLSHMLEDARRRGYKRISLETGSMDFFRTGP